MLQSLIDRRSKGYQRCTPLGNRSTRCLITNPVFGNPRISNILRVVVRSTTNRNRGHWNPISMVIPPTIFIIIFIITLLVIVIRLVTNGFILLWVQSEVETARARSRLDRVLIFIQSIRKTIMGWVGWRIFTTGIKIKTTNLHSFSDVKSRLPLIIRNPSTDSIADNPWRKALTTRWTFRIRGCDFGGFKTTQRKPFHW